MLIYHYKIKYFIFLLDSSYYCISIITRRTTGTIMARGCREGNNKNPAIIKPIHTTIQKKISLILNLSFFLDLY